MLLINRKSCIIWSMYGLLIEVTYSGDDNDLTIVSLKGYIDATTVEIIEQKLGELISLEKYKLIIDLKDTEYINSSGWGVFLRDLKNIRENNGALVLANMSPDVLNVFETMEFSKIFKSFDSLEEACASFR